MQGVESGFESMSVLFQDFCSERFRDVVLKCCEILSVLNNCVILHGTLFVIPLLGM